MKRPYFIDRFIHWLKHRLHYCAQDGCWEKGRECYLPDNYDQKQPDDWVCGIHSHDMGYCPACGMFWGGVDSFDFRPSGLCDNCQSEAEADDYCDEDEPDYDRLFEP